MAPAEFLFAFDGRHGVLHDLRDRRFLVGQAIDEGCIRPVLQETPHEIRDQVCVRPHRRVDAAGHAQLFAADHLLVDGLAHAVQALELVRVTRGRGNAHGGDGLCVVGGELRIERAPVGEQQAKTGEIGHIGMELAREHRIVGKPALLRPLDLAVPVGALHQAYRNLLACVAGHPAQPAQNRDRPFAIGLHGNAKARPARKRRIHESGREQPERQIQPILLFRVDGEPQAEPPGGSSKFDDARQQFVHQSLFLAGIEAGMDRRQLDRDAWPRHQLVRRQSRAGRRRIADGFDGAHVAAEITIGVGGRPRPLAQHVVREPIPPDFERCGTRQRFLDGAAENEIVAQDLHGLPQRRADEGLTRAGHETLEDSGWARALGPAQLHHPSCEHQTEGGGVHEQAVGMAEMLFPASATDFLGDQGVCRVLVGNAQQRLGEAHQDDAFLGGQAVFVHEGIDAAMLVPIGARRADQSRCPIGDAVAFCRGEDGPLDESADKAHLVHQMIGRNLVALGQSCSRSGSVLDRPGFPGRTHFGPPVHAGGRTESYHAFQHDSAFAPISWTTLGPAFRYR